MVELLAVIIIMGILSTIVVASVTHFLTDSKEKTYKELESNMEVAAQNYFLEHNSEIPTSDKKVKIYLKDLIQEQYSKEIHDPDNQGNTCNKNTSYVEATNSNTTNLDLTYKVCLVCSKYKSSGCNN